MICYFGNELLVPAIHIPEEYLKSISNIFNKYWDNCEGGKYKAHINARGELYPCVFAQHSDLKVWDLLKNSFSYLWENGNWKFFREKRNLNDTKCIKCKYFFLCKGGCPGIAYEFYNTVNKPEPRCGV